MNKTHLSIHTSEATNEIIEFYRNYDEDNRLVRSRARSSEFLTTLEVLKKHLSGCRALIELGAGTGRYSLYYAEQGMEVTAVELVPEQAQTIRQKAQDKRLSNLTVYCQDARSLSNWTDASFDAVLCLGPLYHLRSKSERSTCLAECVRILKPGGVLACSYINKYAAIAYYCKLNMFLGKELLQIIQSGDFSSKAGIDRFMDISCFLDPAEMEKELSAFPLKVIDHVGVDGIHALLEEAIEKMDEPTWDAWFNYHLSICRERSILGYSSHGLVVGRVKRGVIKPKRGRPSRKVL